MASAMNSQFRIFFIASSITLSLLWFDALHAQEAAPPPDYVIAQFGNAPAVPKGPLSEELQSAVQVALIDSLAQSSWGGDQAKALGEIAESKDPRIAWIISDLMRFISARGLHAELANAASRLLGVETPNENHWGVVTDHLIAWDIPAPPDYLRSCLRRGIPRTDLA
jgi:hypothetical protein